MPAAGRKPSDGPKHGRTPVVHDWHEVPDVPYDGKKPSLPRHRRFVDKEGGVHRIPLHEQTRAWWRDVSTMPHCVLWAKSDWRFAVATALVADMLYQGDRQAAAELRMRERVLGTTLDARRDLRIRYVKSEAAADPDSTESGQAEVPATVSSLEDRRRRITNAP